MSVYRCIAWCSNKAKILLIGDMVKSGLITVSIGQSKVNNVYKVGCLVEPNETIFGLDVKMNVMVTMDKLNARNLQMKSVQVRDKWI